MENKQEWTPLILGKRLNNYLSTAGQGWTLLPEDYGSWVAGGCWILAEAVLDWLGTENAQLYVLENEEGNSEHVLVRCGDFYLDGDGVSTKDEFLDRWELDEMIDGPVLVKGSRTVLRSTVIPEDRSLSSQLSDDLRKHFKAQIFVDTLKSFSEEGLFIS